MYCRTINVIHTAVDVPTVKVNPSGGRYSYNTTTDSVKLGLISFTFRLLVGVTLPPLQRVKIVPKNAEIPDQVRNDGKGGTLHLKGKVEFMACNIRCVAALRSRIQCAIEIEP